MPPRPPTKPAGQIPADHPIMRRMAAQSARADAALKALDAASALRKAQAAAVDALVASGQLASADARAQLVGALLLELQATTEWALATTAQATELAKEQAASARSAWQVMEMRDAETDEERARRLDASRPRKRAKKAKQSPPAPPLN